MEFFKTQTSPESFGIDRGQTIRYPSNVLFAVNSADRFKTLAQARSASGPSPFNYAINKNENLLAGSLTRVALTEFVMPYNIPNVNPATDTIGCAWQSTIGGNYTSTIVSLPTGFYTGQQLSKALTSTLEATPGLSSIVVNYGQSGFFNAFQLGNSNNVQMFPVDKSAYPNAKTLFDIMNFTTGKAPTPVDRSGIASLKPTDYIDVVCDQLTYNQDVRDSTSQPVNRDVLARIYLQNSNTGNILPNPVYQNGLLNNTPTTSSISTLILTSPDGGSFNTPLNGGAENGLVTSQNYPTIIGTSPFTIYREFNTPKYIKWGGEQNIPGYLKVALYDDRGNQLTTNVTDTASPFSDNNQPDWQFSALASEN